MAELCLSKKRLLALRLVLHRQCFLSSRVLADSFFTDKNCEKKMFYEILNKRKENLPKKYLN